MATTDVRVRLSAEGVAEVVSALQKVGREAQAASSRSSKAFDATNASLARLRGLLPALGAVAAVNGLRRVATSVLEFADNLDEAAGSLGVTTDFLQELQFVAIQTGVPVEKLAASLGILQRNIEGAASKGQPLLELTNGVSVAATNADGSLRGAEEVLVDLVAAFESLPAGTARTAAAFQLFGKSGRELVNLLGVGSEEFARLRNEAEATGFVLQSETVTQLGQINDALDILGRNLTVGFASGLLDVPADDFERLRDALTDPQLVESARSLAKEIRDLVRFVNDNKEALFILATTLKGTAIGARAGGLRGAGIGAVLGFGAGIAGVGIAGGGQEAPTPDTRRVITGTPVNALPPDPTTRVVDPAAEAKAKAAADKVARDREKAAREAERAEEARQRAAEATLDYEAQLLEQQGRRHEAELAALDLELAKYRENLTARGDLDQEEIDRRVARADEIGTQLADFNEAQRKAQAAFSDLAAKRVEIEEMVARGQISATEGAAAIVALDKERLVSLTKIADTMTAIAEASGDPEMIQNAQALQAQLAGVRTEADATGRAWAEARDRIANEGEAAFANFFESVLDGTQSVDDAFKALLDNIKQTFLRLISEKLAEQLFSSLFNSGSSGQGSSGGIFNLAKGFFGSFFGAQKKAAGGLISGPGGPTSDSIPAWLSNGEYVVRASAVRQPGTRELLESINRGMHLPPLVVRERRRFAAGGYVQSLPTSQPGAAGAAARGVTLQFSDRMVDMTLREAIERMLAAERWKL